MKELYLLDDAIISPLGFSTLDNLKSIKAGISGLKPHTTLTGGGFYSGKIEEEVLQQSFLQVGDPALYSKLEQMMLLAIQKVLSGNPELKIAETALIISTTKGNIALLEESSNFKNSRVMLGELGKLIKDFFGFTMEPIIISNACVSGGLALAVARRFINAGKFSQAIVVGGDLVSDFVVSGFQSFQALSSKPCSPFSKKRDGISLGEAAAAILVGSGKKPGAIHISITGDSSRNDANHISGPSRTGEGLYKSITAALKEAQISAEDVNYISAHGTATIYNDEMEAIAFHRAGLQEVAVNSFKGYYGHTLGASALLESILTKHSMLNNELFTSLNFEEFGISKSLNVLESYKKKEVNYALKTASGFGGTNLALVFKKEAVNV